MDALQMPGQFAQFVLSRQTTEVQADLLLRREAMA